MGKYISNYNRAGEVSDELVNAIAQKLIKQGISNPTGTIISLMGNTAPSGYLICDGKNDYLISEHTALANYIEEQFGTKNYFGGNGTTTFAVPDLTDKFLKGDTTAGISENAGLPNITGSFGNTTRLNANDMNSRTSGAFSYTNQSLPSSSASNQDVGGKVNFDASLSNDIYRKKTRDSLLLVCKKKKNTWNIPQVFI